MASDRRLIVGAIPVAALAGGLATTLLIGGGTTRPVTAQDTAALTAEQRSTATSLEGAFMRVSDTAGPATVRITANIEEPVASRGGTGGGSSEEDPFSELFGQGQGRGRQNSPFGGLPTPPRSGRASGSGVIIRADGYILTNDHVVENAKNSSVKVTLSDNTTYTGKVSRDPFSDLAVVKISAGKPLPYVKLADSSQLRVGQWAIAIGSPFGQQNTMTTGIVSALHRKSVISEGGVSRNYPNLVQTDASINPGNSGGPLLNINGEMIGLNVAIYSPSGTNAGIGFAIPSNTAKLVADQLISKGKVTRASFGVVPSDIPPGQGTRLGTLKGAYITEVAPDTAADKAGVQPGDVITRFGTTDVSDEITLRDAISTTAPGSRINVTVLRGGKTEMLSATVTAREDEKVAATNAPAARKPAVELGINATALTTDIAGELRLPEGTKGVLVAGVTGGSPASDGDLTRGNVITAVNGKPVTSVEGLNAAMASAKSGDTVTLSILRPNPTGRPSRAVVNITVP